MSVSEMRCEVCGEDLAAQSAERRTGRPARYCSSACRQRAYRRRADEQRVGRNSGTSSLPAALGSFVGRDRDLSALESLLDRHRLVTLLGPGGAGKTRLAIELASRVRGRFPGGVHLVELASLTDPALLTRHVADSLGIADEIGTTTLDTIADALSWQAALLVLDNCEHLVADAARLAAALLRRGASLTIVATSRESLELPGEALFRVCELSLPEPSKPLHAMDLLASDAVKLFVERATASAP